MNYTAKLIDEDTYQISTVDTILDVNGDEVQIPNLVGIFSRTQLESDIATAQARLAAIQAVLDAQAAELENE